ncbi:MAG: choice-of-anchor D domain-containing protein, partial [Sphingobacteriales bacterium]
MMMTISGSYTKEVWINPTAASLVNFPNLISGDFTTGTALYLNNGVISAGHGPTFSETSGGAPLVAGNWYHVAVTFDDATNSMNLYLDGVMVSSGTPLDYVETTLDLGIFAGTNLFAGRMDEVRIWNVARTAGEISANMNCKLRGDEPGLIAYYDFNQGIAGGNNATETVLLDRTDNCSPQNGTLNGFFLTGNTSNWVAPGATTGICGGAVPNIRVLGTGALCILDGDATPTAADGTDFGFYTAPGIDRTFTITNNGSSTLNISGINISGTDASWFTVISGPVLTSLAPGQSTTFTVRFSGIGLGVRTATITVVNDDADETNYDFAVQGEGTISVPVTLLNFSGTTDDKVVNLNWRTANEINNRGFEVQRSNARQTEWTKIGFVAASGQSASTYRITDFTPLDGTNTYRLKQTDLDGRVSYSNVLAFNFDVKGTVVRTYPNPFAESFVIAFNDESLINTRAEISTVSGARVATVILTNFNQSINFSRFAPGVYLVKLANGEV